MQRFLNIFLFTLIAVYTHTQAQDVFAPDISFGGQLVIGIQGDTNFDLNPFQIKSPAHEEIIQMIFGHGLTKTSDKVNKPQDLFSIIFASPDFRIWRIRLKRNIHFQNGDRMRNTDVAFTFEVVKKHRGFNLNRKLDFRNLSAVTSKGDLEVVFELVQPDEEFAKKLADIPILSQRYYGEILKKGYRVFSQKLPMGMGAFKFEFRTESLLMLLPWQLYFTGAPFLKRVKIQFFKDEQSLIDAFVNEEVDYIEFPNLDIAVSLEDLMASKITVFPVRRSEIKVSTMLFNLKKPPLSDPVVREAVYLAINRKQIVDSYVRGNAAVANTLIPDDHPSYERSLFSKNYDYKPQDALRMLRQAGWRLNAQNVMSKNGQLLTFTLAFSQNSDLEREVARSISIYLSELGIQVEPTPVLPGEKETLLNKNAYQAMLYDYTYHIEDLAEAVSDFYSVILGARRKPVNYQNSYLDALFKIRNRRKNFPKDVAQRFQTFARNEMPAVFLYFDSQLLIGVNKRFYDFRTTTNTGRDRQFRMQGIHNWYVPKELQRFE